MIPKDFTPQENLVAEVLSELGIRYEQQVEFGKYTVDFYSEGTVIEADGIYGHLKKADKKRDAELLKLSAVMSILHIKSTTKSGILQEIRENFGWNKEGKNPIL